MPKLPSLTAILPEGRTLVRTLRFRLMAWNAVVVLLTAIAVLATLREGVRSALYHELDQLHAEDTRQIALMLGERPFDIANFRETLEQHATGHQQHGWFVALFDPAGDLLWASENAPHEALKVNRANQGDGVSETEDARFLHTRFLSPVAGIAAVHVGSHLHSIHRDLARIDRQVAIVTGLVLLIAPLCGYWLAGRATKPVADMIQVSTQLRPTHMDERLPLRGTGDELDQLARTINQLLDRIAFHLGRKQDLLANAAHELRTPLAAIRSSIEVTLNEPRSAAEYEELLDELIEETVHLERLVNQLLLLSETGAGAQPPHSQILSLPEAVQKSVEMFRGVAEAHGLTLNSQSTPCYVRGNLDHLRQVVNNLLDNAIKFTPAGGKVNVYVHPSNNPDFAEIIITDTGRGIPPEDQQRVFERFFRSRAPHLHGDAPRGTGLGLSICAAVVAAHEGTIHLKSKSGEGTTFTVRIPSVSTDADLPSLY